MSAQFLSSIHQVPAEAWQALSGGDYPFTQHAFLAALEDSGSVGGDSGWQPHHLVLGELASPRAVMPLYIKWHSFGEYVFDWAWADAYRRCGLAYYPKLVAAAPFTPCTGPRLLTGERAPEAVLGEARAALEAETLRLDASGWHLLFPPAALSEPLSAQGSVQRLSCQFHWHNRGYRDFEDFLATLSSRKRKNLRKERRRVNEQGFEFTVREGADITAEEWDFFYQLYQMTYLKRSMSAGYLSRDCFHRLGRALPDKLVMIIARHGDTPIAAALFFADSTTLYGRYWGCRAEFDFLHFETCYYRGIDYAIEKGLQRFDGGAQGEHKLQRGFEPVITCSNHWLADSRLRGAIAEFARAEAADVRAYARAAQSHLPYRQHMNLDTDNDQ